MSHKVKTNNSWREQHLSSGYSAIFCLENPGSMWPFFHRPICPNTAADKAHSDEEHDKELKVSTQSDWASVGRANPWMSLRNAAAMRGFTLSETMESIAGWRTSTNAKVWVIHLILHLWYSANYTSKRYPNCVIITLRLHSYTIKPS